MTANSPSRLDSLQAVRRSGSETWRPYPNAGSAPRVLPGSWRHSSMAHGSNRPRGRANRAPTRGTHGPASVRCGRRRGKSSRGPSPAWNSTASSPPRAESDILKMRFSGSVRCPFADQTKVGCKLFLRPCGPRQPLRSLPGNGSSVTRLIYFSLLTHSRKRSKHARKIARNTQLQGCVAPWRPIRNPKPRQMLQAGAASASVSERFHSISSSSLENPAKQPGNIGRRDF